MPIKKNTFSEAVLGSLKSPNNKRRKLIRKKKTPTLDEKIIKGLKKRVEEIKPLFLENQLKAVDTAIDLAESILENKKAQRDLIKKEFLINPSLIKEFIISDLTKQIYYITIY